MKNTVLLHVGDDDQLSWSAIDAIASQHDDAASNVDAAPIGDATRIAATKKKGDAQTFAAESRAHEMDIVLIVPAQKVLLQEVPFAVQERKLLRQTIPYSLEEQLIDDVDTQHFALGPVANNQVSVAIIDKQWLGDLIQQCRAAGLDIKRVLPEQLLLPYREHCWTLRVESGRWVVRVGPYSGFAMEPNSAVMVLQLLLDSANEMPQKLLLQRLEQSDESIDILLAQLPELLRGSVEVLNAEETFESGNPVIDFLQGAFARTLPWQRWWLSWRPTAIVLAVAIVVHLIVGGVQHYRLNKQNIALRQQIEEVYRSVEPRGVVNDPELQLRRKVQALKSRQGGAALPLFQQVGDVLKSIEGIAVQNLTYSERQGELRVNMSAHTFKDVEAVRAAIANKGLTAQLVGSNTDGDKTRAQLRITERK